MSLFRKVLLAFICVISWAAPLPAAVLSVSGDTDVKPPDPDFVYTRSVFDCTPLMVLPVTVGLTGSLVNDTTGGVNQIETYSCAPWYEPGPEHVYRLEVAQGDTLEFHAVLADVQPEVDHDIFLLDGCDTDSCLVGANTEITAVLTGGTYFLIVDAAVGPAPGRLVEGPYTLDVSARYVGVPPLVCEPGFATEVDINQPQLEFPGNLFGADNLIQSYECSPILLTGGEAWYTLTLPPPTDNQFGGKNFSQFKVDFTEVVFPLDVALWLFDGCGIDPVCLDYANDWTGGQGETLTYRNETDQEVTVLLAVDCFRAPTESGLGYFTIRFTNDLIVPTEKTSFGSLRALYR